MEELSALAKPVLTDEQCRAFISEGFIKIAGLIPSEDVEGARRAIAEAGGFQDDDPSTWAGQPRVQPDFSELTQRCWTPAIVQVGRELIGRHPIAPKGQRPSPYLESIGKPATGLKGLIPVLAYPEGGDRIFVAKPPPAGYHLDGKHYVSHWPQHLYLTVFVYLTDVTSYGGATVVIPGSHRKIFEHWCLHPEEATSKQVPDLSYQPPVPVVGTAGDVIFMHYLCAHSGSPNHDDHIRYGLNSGMGPDINHPYERPTPDSIEEFSPLDWTLYRDTIEETISTNISVTG